MLIALLGQFLEFSGKVLVTAVVIGFIILAYHAMAGIQMSSLDVLFTALSTSATIHLLVSILTA